MKLTAIVCLLCAAVIGFGQSTKRNTRPVNPKPAATPQAEVPQPTPLPFSKRNARPQSTEVPQKLQQPAVKPNYIYEFTQPNFLVSHIVIEHDEAGRGTISFMTRGLDEPQSDPVNLSDVTLARIKTAMAALDFLNSTERYQTVRDYSNLGNLTITYRREGRERTVKFNWTDNKDAKTLMDEYRKVANQYIWQFDMSVARENQPLNTPSLMDTFDSYLRRNEISDPRQMLPLLTEISNDERIPLIARNHAAKLAEKIGKTKN
jgi:hypothetical protein